MDPSARMPFSRVDESPRHILALGAGSVLCLLGGVVLFAIVLDPMFATFGTMGFLGLAAVAASLFRDWYRDYYSSLCAWREAARLFGLQLRPHLTWADVKPFRRLPFFHFVNRHASNLGAGFLLEGTMDGRPLTAFELVYAGMFPGRRVRPNVLWSERLVLVVFTDLGPLPDFSLGPEEHAWDNLVEDWPRDLNLEPVVAHLWTDSPEPAVLRGKKHAVLGLFSPVRVRALKTRPGWSVECRDGRLLVYRHGVVIPAWRLVPHLREAAEIVRVLTMPLDETAADEPPSMIHPGQQDAEVPTVPRALPAIRPTYTFWFGVVLAASGVISVPVAVALPGELGDLGGFAMLCAAASLSSPFLFVAWYLDRFRVLRHVRKLGPTFGLEFRDRVTWHDLAPFEELPLFRLTEDCKVKAGFLMCGDIDGRRVLFLEFAYNGRFPGPTNDGLWFRSGQHFLVLVAGLGSVPDFHLGPRANEWDDCSPGWPSRLDVGLQAKALGPEDAVNIRARDVTAVRQFFAPVRVTELGDLTGWTLECRAGNLLLYEEGTTAEAVVPFVRRALDIVSILTMPVAVPDDLAPPTAEQAGAAPRIRELPAEVLGSFLGRIHAEPNLVAHRLALARLLEEHADARAEMVRWSCRHDQLPVGAPQRNELAEHLDAWGRRHLDVWLGPPPAPSILVSGYEGGLLRVSILAPRAEGCTHQSDWPGFNFACWQGWVTAVSFVGSDETFEELSDAWPVVEEVERLRLKGVESLTDRGLRGLWRLTRLRHLDLGECPRLTDAGLDALREPAWLEVLDLTGCEQFTDEGLVRLRELRGLRRLVLPATRPISEDVKATLREALPHCAVV